MNSLGLMITDMEGNSPIQKGAAATRFFGRLTVDRGSIYDVKGSGKADDSRQDIEDASYLA